MTINKPNCYNCKYRGDIPGDAHSCCRHPKCVVVLDDPIGAVMQLIRGTGVIKGMHVVGNKHGIDNGWFQFPWNFDPIWLEECDGFESNKDDGE